MHLVLTGATGLVGSGILHTMLTTPSVTKISILSRRAVPQAEGQPKAHVIIHKDFATYGPSVLAQLKDVDGVVWAQGISVTQVSKEEYKDITITYPLAFAKSLSESTSPQEKDINFVYISGHGATTTPGLFTPHFALIKGQAELALLALSSSKETNSLYKNLKPWSLRLGFVDPSRHEEIHKYIPVLDGVRKLSTKYLFPAVGWAMPWIVAPTKDIGKLAVALAMGKVGTEEGVESVGGDVEMGRIVNQAGLVRLVAGLKE